MIKKFIYLSPILLLSAALNIDSNSAPASTTGAPGEKDCTTSGCHQSFVVNNGPGSVSLDLENGASTYICGKTYTLNVEVDQASLVRFGFQMVALKNKDNTNCGTFIPTDESRNQVTTGYGNLTDRKYITYTYKSTSALTVGKGNWSFNWTAPATDEGPVTFYVAAIAADNNGNDLGDYCYTNKLTINSDPSQIKNFDLTIFPNPVKDKINVNFSIPSASFIKIELLDLQGKIVEEFFSSPQKTGDYQLSFPLSKVYKGGFYFVRFAQNEKISQKKIFIAN